MEFQELLQIRRSVRAYDPDRKVTREQIEEIVKAAQLAPTWKNSQTGRFYAICTDEVLEDIRSTALPPFNQKNSGGAALIVTTFEKNIAGFTNGKPDNELGNLWGAYDLGCQSTYMILKASDLGLDTLIMGIRDSRVLREKLAIPEEEEIVSVIAVGYRAADAKMRKCKDLEEVLKIY